MYVKRDVSHRCRCKEYKNDQPSVIPIIALMGLLMLFMMVGILMGPIVYRGLCNKGFYNSTVRVVTNYTTVTNFVTVTNIAEDVMWLTNKNSTVSKTVLPVPESWVRVSRAGDGWVTQKLYDSFSPVTNR